MLVQRLGPFFRAISKLPRCETRLGCRSLSAMQVCCGPVAIIVLIWAMHSNPTAISICTFARSDLAAALVIQSQAYPAFLQESAASFASRLEASQSYCLTAQRQGQPIGYLLAHGWPRNAPPELGAPLVEFAPPEILFIHDLAVAAAGQGLGIGRRLVDHAFDRAVSDGLKSAELVAVEGAASFWQAMGFAELDASPEIAAKLAGYGRRAKWMGRAIG